MNVSMLAILYFDRIDFSEGINLKKKTSTLKECNIYHYWHFLNKRFQFQGNLRNRCHDLLIMGLNLSDVVILIIKHSNYRFIISGIRKSEATDVTQNTSLLEKSRTLLNIKICYQV